MESPVGFGLNVEGDGLCSWSADGSVRAVGRNVRHQSWAIKVGNRVDGPMMAEHTAKAAISNGFGQSRGPQTEDMGSVEAADQRWGSACAVISPETMKPNNARSQGERCC